MVQTIASHGLRRYAIHTHTHKFIWIHQEGSKAPPQIEAYKFEGARETFIGYLTGEHYQRVLAMFGAGL